MRDLSVKACFHDLYVDRRNWKSQSRRDYNNLCHKGGLLERLQIFLIAYFFGIFKLIKVTCSPTQIVLWGYDCRCFLAKLLSLRVIPLTVTNALELS